MEEIVLKYKVVNIEEITKEALEKMLEEAYNDGYKDATTFYTKPLNDYSIIIIIDDPLAQLVVLIRMKEIR